MTEQTLPFVAGSATSKAAALDHSTANAQRQEVLDWFARQGPDGATDDACQRALGLSGSSQRPRRVELVKLGLLIDSGKTRRTPSGRAATVWRCP